MEKEKILDFNAKLEEGINKKILPEYVYSYPPKRAFRKFTNPLIAGEVWEDYIGDLNIYIHIPFCKHRCTFCTLFACTEYTEDYLDAYINQICNQISFYSKYLSKNVIRTLYFGGGTPSLLSKKALSKVFKTIKDRFPRIDPDVEITMEGTPESYTNEVLDYLLELGVNRISIGVQSFNDKELKLSGRKTRSNDLKKTLKEISKRFGKFNLDLIYGLAGQDRTTWFDSLNDALIYKPAILSLYPVVLRPQASMSNLYNKETQNFFTNEEKYDIYDETVKLLATNKYKQHSFTRFSLSAQSSYLQETLDFKGTPLLGIGVGARSYNGKFHYDWSYSPSVTTAHDMINNFLNIEYKEGHKIHYGIILEEDELKRRYIILNLTLGELNIDEYVKTFKSATKDDFKDYFNVLINNRLVDIANGNVIKLTSMGFKYSNLIARLFFSEKMLTLEKDYKSV